MPIATGKFFRIEVKGEADLQAVNNTLWYRLTSAAAADAAFVLETFSAEWQRWIMGISAVNYHVYRYNLDVLSRMQTYTPTAGGSLRIKPIWSERHVQRVDDFGNRTLPHPSFVAVSCRKNAGGVTMKVSQTGLIAESEPDTKFRGGLRLGTVCEAATTGNRLTSSFPLNYLSSYRAAADAFLVLGDSTGIIGPVFTAQLAVPSMYGPGNAVRGSGDSAGVLFRVCTSMTVSQFLGSQVSRKQVERFQ